LYCCAELLLLEGAAIHRRYVLPAPARGTRVSPTKHGRYGRRSTIPDILILLHVHTDVIVPGLVLHMMPDGTGTLPNVALTGQPVGIWLRDRDHHFARFVAHTGEPSAMVLSLI
jgi:hypothetical protein